MQNTPPNNAGANPADPGPDARDPFTALPAFPLDDVRPFYAGESTRSRNVTAALDQERRHASRPHRRRMLNMLKVANAARALDRLPRRGEAFHVVMTGNFDAWHLVPAVVKLARPATVRGLHIATLGFNRPGAEDLLALIDAGTVAAVRFVCSCYFRSVDADVFDFLHAGLTSRGHRCVAIRSHAKIVVFDLSDGRQLVIESSANLRSCHNIEAFTLTHDAALAEFHRGWLDEVIEAAER